MATIDELFPVRNTQQPAAASIDELFPVKQPEQPEQELMPRDYAIGGAENVLSAVTGAGAEIAGGIAGLLSMPFTGSDAGDVVESVSDALTYQPRTEAGQAIQQKVAETLSPVGEWISEKPGDYFFELAQSPQFKMASALNPLLKPLADNPEVMGAMGATAIPAALELIGLKGAKRIKTKVDAKKMLANEIAEGNRNIDNITKTLDANGKLISNPAAKKIAGLFNDEIKGKQGAILIENMNPATRQQFNKMLDVVENQRARGAEYAMDNRATNVVGESIARRVKALNRVREQASNKLGRALDKVGNERVDVSQPAQDFLQKMEEAGVQFSADQGGNIVSNFDNARLNLGDVMPQQQFDKVVNMLKAGEMTAKEAHDFKRFVREFVSYDSPGLPQVGTKQSKILSDSIKSLSTDIGNQVKEISPEYAKANQVYESIADPLNKVSKQLKDMGVDTDIGEAKLGHLAKRIGTNYTSKAQITDMINSIDQGLSANNIKFKDNIKQQVAALDMLDEMFNTSKTESPFGFKAGIEGGTRVAAGDKMALMQMADNAVKKLREKDFNEKMKVLRATTKTGNK